MPTRSSACAVRNWPALRRETTNPNELASRALVGDGVSRTIPTAARPTARWKSVPRITADDLRDYVRRVFARNELKIAIVGDIDAADRRRADRPRVRRRCRRRTISSRLPNATPQRARPPHRHRSRRAAGRGHFRRRRASRATIRISWPAYIVNHILGGGSFSSRLYREVREKRGLAYGVSDSLIWFKHAAVVLGGTATRADRTGRRARDHRGGDQAHGRRRPDAGRTRQGQVLSQGLLRARLDTSTKIAGQLVQIQLDNLGIDYIAAPQRA